MTSKDPVAARIHLLAQVDEAARAVAPLWPLSTYIAVNPLWDLRQMPFHEAVEYAAQVLGIAGFPSPALFAEAYAERRITAADLRAVLDSDHAQGRPAGVSIERSDGGGPEGPPATTAAERYDHLFGTSIADAVDREVAKWCAA